MLNKDRHRKNDDQSKHIVHELQQPISAMAMLADLTLNSIRDVHCGTADEEIRQNLQLIVDQGKRCKHIIQNMRSSAETLKKQFSATDVNDIINQSIKQLRYHTHKDGVAIRHDLQPQIPPIQADAQSLKQLFANLMDNAVDAMKNSQRKCLRVGSNQNKKGINIQISDSGCGIDEQEKSHIFESEYTNKGPEGTGFGLVICKSIVNTHGGTINITSKKNAGTRVDIFLPYKPFDSTHQPTETKNGSPKKGVTL